MLRVFEELPSALALTRAGETEGLTQLSHVAMRPIEALSHQISNGSASRKPSCTSPESAHSRTIVQAFDPAQIVQMRELVRSLRGRHTIVLSSHILSEMSETCDRILVMRQGEIQASGTERELVDRLGTGIRLELTISEEFA